MYQKYTISLLCTHLMEKKRQFIDQNFILNYLTLCCILMFSEAILELKA